MELSKINTIEKTLRNYEAENAPYHYSIEYVSLDSNTLHSWTGSRRVTGADKFKETIEKLVELPSCKSIHIKVYSGRTGNKVILSDDIAVRGKDFYVATPQVQPEHKREKPESAQAQTTNNNTAQAGGMELIATVLGIGSVGGLNGTEMLGSLLSFRDQQLDTKYRMMELQKEIAQLTLEKKNLTEQLNFNTSTVEQLEAENDALQSKIEDLEEEVERLQKYVPENSPLGISLTALLGSVGERVIKNIVSKNPEKVASFLGTDGATLMGLFEAPNNQAAHKNTIVNHADVEIVPAEAVSEQRKHELNAIEGMTEWLKTLPLGELSMIQQLFVMFTQDLSLIELVYNWANGKKTKTTEFELQ